MGYHIFSYAINTRKIQLALGSKDVNLFSEIQETDTFKLYSSQDFHGHISTRQALEHLIFGEAYNILSAHAYWYAFIAICAYLGKSLPSTHEIKLGYETDFINEFLKSDFGVEIVIEEVLINEKNPFNLPRVTDWPISGFLDKDDLIALEPKFSAIHITNDMLEKLLDEDEEREMAYDGIRQIKENITYCIKNDINLISFCH